jgi:hypothetical protein
MKKLLPILFALTVCALHTHGQSITRGATEGEIYFPNGWYLNSTSFEFVPAIWRSTDNGRHLTTQYAATTIPAEDAVVGIVSDANLGVLYGVNYDKLYISYDYGVSWEFVENTQGSKYFSGNKAGEIFKQYDGIYLSTDFGENFTMLINYVNLLLEIGTIPGELFGLSLNSNNSRPDSLFYSNEYSCIFTFKNEFNDTVAGIIPGGYYPVLSRGAVPGELYLVTWHLPCNYYIYFSSDYGQTFQLQYQSDECNFYYWDYSFSAGREPGSFYVTRSTGNDFESSTHMLHYIDYSIDYGKTFTTFFHDTDIDYDGNPTSITHTVSAIVEPTGYGTVAGTGRFAEGTEVIVTATPNEGYEFVNWTEGETIVSELAAYTFTVERTLTLVANFKLINGIALDNANLFKSFPNPFSSIVTFKFPLLSNEGLLSIYSTMGNTVFTGKLNDTKTSFDLSHLPQGVYIYSIETDGRPFYRGVMVKQ